MDTVNILDENQAQWALVNPKELLGLSIVEQLCVGKNPPAIRDTLGITPHVFDAALVAIAARVNLPNDTHTFKACPTLIRENLEKLAAYTRSCQALEKQYRESLLTFDY